jgi:competence ComEA-like helix-hairpin-helix protein
LATAGGLLFIGGQGGIVALDAKTGQNLWHVDVGQARCDGVCLEASAMTYMVGGKQYVAMSGYGKLTAYSLAEEGAELTTSVSKASGPRPDEPVHRVELADAPGKAATVRDCTSCHTAEMWSQRRLSRDAWDGTLQRMTARGMTLSNDEHEIVLDYLSKYLGVINVNTATAADLVRGLGITESIANAMIAHREKTGAFKDIEDLKAIEGLDPTTIDSKKNLIAF